MKKFAALGVLTVLVFFPGVVIAQGNTLNPKKDLEQSKQNIEDARNKRIEALEKVKAKRCELVQARLVFHVQKIEAIHEHRGNLYQKVIARLNNVALRLENNGRDANELHDAIATLSDMKADFESNFALYEAEIANAANIACADDGSLRNTIQKALSALRTAKADSQDIKEFIQEDLKPLLQSIKADLHKPVDKDLSEDDEVDDSTSIREQSVDGNDEGSN